MEENDRRITETGGELNLLVDSSAYNELVNIEESFNISPFDLLETHSKVRLFFAESMIQEIVAGRKSLTQEIKWMFERSLQDEGAFVGKESRFLYNDVNGNIRTVVLNNISPVDYSQILLAQNHQAQNLTLVTNDHKMLKSAGALLSNRLSDVNSLLDLFAEKTPEAPIRDQWQQVRAYYKANSSYNPPKTVNYIEDIDRKPHPITGEIPKLKLIYTRKKPK